MDASSDVHHFTSTITREKCCSSQQNDTTTTASNQLQTDSYKVNPIPGSLFICYKFVGGVCTVEEVQVVIAPVGLTLQRSDLTQALVRVLEATVAYATLICTFYYYFILVWLWYQTVSFFAGRNARSQPNIYVRNVVFLHSLSSSLLFIPPFLFALKLSHSLSERRSGQSPVTITNEFFYVFSVKRTHLCPLCK